METNIIYNIDCLTGLRNLPDDSIDCCVTSPPYFNLRDYGVNGQIGLEDTPEQYIQKLVGVFHEVRRVLAPAGTLWVNIGDCYAGSGKGAANYPDNAMKYKQGTNRGTVGQSAIVKKFDGYKSKDLIGIPWMLAFALRADGWFLRHLRKREPPDCVSRTDAQQRGSGWAVRPITPLETRAGGVGLFGRGRKHLRTQKTARRCDAGTDICGTDKVRCGRQGGIHGKMEQHEPNR